MNPITLRALGEEFEGFYKLSNVELLKSFAHGMKSLQGVEKLKHVQSHLANPDFVGAVRANSPHILPKLYEMANQGARTAIGGTMMKASHLGAAALELGGLGILGHDSFKEMRRHGWSGLSSGHKKELAGLGVLGLHPAYEIGKAGVEGVKKLREKRKSTTEKVSYVNSALSLFTKKSQLDIGSRAAGALQGAMGAAKKVAPAATMMTAAQRAAKMQAHASRAASFANQMSGEGGHLPAVVGTLLHR